MYYYDYYYKLTKKLASTIWVKCPLSSLYPLHLLFPLSLRSIPSTSTPPYLKSINTLITLSLFQSANHDIFTLQPAKAWEGSMPLQPAQA